jgi:peptidoglycan/xylan/chitin deacetylase (PgdA/CDA1 family)
MSGLYNYSPITSRPAGSWPGGRSLAVYLCLGVEEYRFGDGHTEDILPGVPAPDHVNTSWRDYGNRVGAFRLLDRLDAIGMPATLLLNTDVYDTAPDVVAAARRSGAEIIGHGLTNSDTLAGMSPADERAYLATVASRIREHEGAAPGGWSSPWLTHTESTVGLLAETGYDYLLDLRFDDQPVWLEGTGRPLLSIPYNLEINDSSSIVGRNASAGEFADMIVDEFDELLEASEAAPLVMNIVVHAFVSGVPFRLRALGRALEHIAAHGDRVWLTRPRDIHSHVVANPAMFPRGGAA